MTVRRKHQLGIFLVGMLLPLLHAATVIVRHIGADLSCKMRGQFKLFLSRHALRLLSVEWSRTVANLSCGRRRIRSVVRHGCWTLLKA